MQKNYFNFFKFLVCIISLCLATQSFAKQQYASVEEMVASQKTIRVVIDLAPGYGNQSASLNLMNRLRQMNFQGTFEVIYPDSVSDNGDDYNIRKKVINLFNLPQDLPPVYMYEDSLHRKIIFLADSEYIKQFNNKQVQPVELSVTGAHDSPSDAQCMEDNQCQRIGESFADFTNSDLFLDFQPWFGYADDAYYVRGKNTEYAVNPSGKFLVFPVATFADAKQYLQEVAAGQALLAKKPALKTFMSRVEDKSVNVLSVYGYTFRKAYNEDTNSRWSELVYPQNILEVIAASRYVQLNGSTDLRKPLIIPVFYNYREEMDELTFLLTQSDWKEYEKQGGAEMRAAIASLGLAQPNVLQTADISDADATAKIENLQPGQILLLSMGSLPKVVFDGLYAHTDTNIWPQMREGQSSLNILALTGKPHFRCVTYKQEDTRWEFGLNYISDQALKTQMQKFYGDKGFCESSIWKKNPMLYQALAKFIIDANDSSSAFAHSFVDLRAEALKPENDRIYRGLQAALKVINSNSK